MSGFDDVRFPTEIDYGSKGGPRFKTTVVTSGGGGETRIGQWTTPRRRWVVGQTIRDIGQITTLRDFFVARQGMLRSFRFRDELDCTAVNAPVSDLGGGVLQLLQAYPDAVRPTTRRVTKPVAGTVVLKRGGAVVGGATINYAAGTVTGAGAAAGLTWSGLYDCEARFDTDEPEFERSDFDEWNWAGIDIVEVLS